jgi:hypothetical protein
MKKISARRQAEWKRKQQQLLLPTSKKKNYYRISLHVALIGALKKNGFTKPMQYGI